MRLARTPLVLASLAVIHSGCTSMSDQKILDTSPYRSLLGENVLVFSEAMNQKAIQHTLDVLHKQQQHNEFGSERYALLFKPGRYLLDVNVDYYVHAAGLGRFPEDVTIVGGVQSTATTEDAKVTTMFWRTAENFKVVPRDKKIFWAVSQASPYRRMHVAGDIQFDKGGWASGGFLANSIIEGKAGLTSGQQWFTRNSQLGSWEGGAWNRVFVGVDGAPKADWPQHPVSVVASTPVIREKPFLTFDASGSFAVFVPDLRRDSRGVSWHGRTEAGVSIPLSDFHIAKPDEDSATSINKALALGKHILFTPGIYPLEETILVTKPDTVLLGIGLPTLVPMTGKAALETRDVPGLKLAGIMVDAGPESTPVLIQIGERENGEGKSKAKEKGTDAVASNPISLHDIYCRIGGAAVGRAEVCMTINSSHVVGDHFWLWQADHGKGSDWTASGSQHGLIVNGDDVTLYGLFNEHFQNYQTLWNGERGRTYFYQSEIPYSPPSFTEWNDKNKPGFASYKVSEHVKAHAALGLGVYSFFRGPLTEANKVRLENAVECPVTPQVTISHIVTFAGHSGGINHPINGLGPVTENGKLNLYDGVPGAK